MLYVKKTHALMLLLFLTFCVSCGDDESNNSAGGEMVEEMDMMIFGRGGSEAGSEGGTAGGNGDEKTYLSYTRLLVDGSNVKGDLIVFDPSQGTESILNTDISREDMDCISRGCILHPSLEWVAWLQREGSKNSLCVAPIDTANRTVDIASKRILSTDALRFEFTNDMIIYSEVKDPNAVNGVSVKYAPIDGSVDAFEFNLINDAGGFSSTLLGEIFIVVTTTLSSMTITFYDKPNDRSVNLFTFGTGQGTGSEFSATQNPVVVAPDLSYLIAITNYELTWRIHSLPVEDAVVEPTSRDLFPTRNAPERCQGNYPFTQVQSAPLFTKDSEHFYLLMSGDCSAGNRLDYDIYRFSKDVNADPVNVTQQPPVNHWSKHDISSFTLNPAEDQISFVATRPNQQGVKSIWVINIPADGEKPTFDCSRSNGQMDLEGTLRCEYIWYDEDDGTADYKFLQYHQTGSF